VTKRWRWGLLGVVGLALLVPVGVLGGGLIGAFGGNRAVQPGATLADGRVTVLQDRFVNAFVVDTGSGVVLIDTGTSPATIEEALAAASFAPADVRAIFLTHGHQDHTGGVAAFPGVPVYAAAAEIPLITGEVGSDSPIGQLAGRQDAGVVPTGLRDGQVVEVDDLEFQAFVIPGHTAGSVAYLVDGVLFLGDSARAASDGSLKQAPWVFSDDLAQNHASLVGLAERIAPGRVRALAFGHTGSLQSGDPLYRYGR